MDCPKCGVHNPEGIERCKICGTELEAPKGPAGPVRKCPFCGTENDKDAPFCTSCNRPLYTLEGKAKKPEKERLEKSYDRSYADNPSSAARTGWASIGGMLLMIGAMFALIDAILMLMISWEISNLADYDQLVRENPQFEGVLASLVVCEGLRLVFIAIALMGSVFAVRRVRWGFAMLGGILGIFAVLPSFLVLVLPFYGLIALSLLIASIIGVILIGISRKEFMLW